LPIGMRASRTAWCVKTIDRVALWSGAVVSWLIIPMVLALVYEVVGRYFFNAPTIWAYDVTFITYGTFFMLGSAYTLQRGGHIRTDSFYGKWSVRTQGMVDAICYALFYFPPLIVFLYVTWDFFWVSYAQSERSVTSPWLPPIWPLKAVMPATCALMLIQGIAEFLRSVHAWRTGEWIARYDPVSAVETLPTTPSI
jgi:TRAP-type mannitol/chloroaromatic compound transport system permease small subunit